MSRLSEESRQWKDGNDTFEVSVCPNCGGRLIHHSFMVADGHDDVDWDFEEWCEDCNGKTLPMVDTCTEFGEVEPSKNRSSSVIL